MVEPPSIRPEFLPVSVLWYADDCKKPPEYAKIFSATNKSRAKMHIALRRANGEQLSFHEYQNIREVADLVVRNLCNMYSKDPRAAGAKTTTKTNFKSIYFTEYRKAVLELEAAEPILRLCAHHWKAEVMIGQAFLRRGGNDKTNDTTNALESSNAPTTSSSDVSISHPPEALPAAPIAGVSDAAPANASKRALVLSPGPKSPSATHSQKRAKDNTALSAQTTSSLSSGECYFFIQ